MANAIGLAADSFADRPPITFDNVVNTLTTISQELHEMSYEIPALDEELARAKHAEKIAYARAYAQTGGTVEDRKQAAVLITEQQSFDVIVAEAKLKAARGRLEYLKNAFDSARTIAATKRAEFMAEPFGQYT